MYQFHMQNLQLLNQTINEAFYKKTINQANHYILFNSTIFKEYSSEKMNEDTHFEGHITSIIF